MAVWKKCLNVNSHFLIFFILIVLSNAWVTLLNFKSCSNPLPHARKCKNKKNSKSISVRCMGKFKTCLSFISSIPAPCYPSSSLSSFLSTVFCVFGSISLGCLAWQRLNDWNIKPSEIFKVHQKGWNAHNLYIWHWQSKLLTYIIWQSTDIPMTVNRYSTDSQWSMYQPSVGRYIGRDIGR